jgi:hypothetical protein
MGEFFHWILKNGHEKKLCDMDRDDTKKKKLTALKELTFKTYTTHLYNINVDIQRMYRLC